MTCGRKRENAVQSPVPRHELCAHIREESLHGLLHLPAELRRPRGDALDGGQVVVAHQGTLRKKVPQRGNEKEQLRPVPLNGIQEDLRREPVHENGGKSARGRREDAEHSVGVAEGDQAERGADLGRPFCGSSGRQFTESEESSGSAAVLHRERDQSLTFWSRSWLGCSPG